MLQDPGPGTRGATREARCDETVPPTRWLPDHDDGASSAYTSTPSPTTDAGTPSTATTTPRPNFPSDLKKLACTWPGCTKAFNRPARLRDHLNSHTNARPFKCPHDGCDKDYIEDKHLKQHVKAVHTRERNFVCTRDGCGKRFVTGTRLNRHQAVHDGADRFRCADCGQSFRKRETLHKHVRKDHLGLPPHECPHPACPEAFGTKARLKRHFDRVHGDVKFWCAECGLAGRRVGFTTEPLLQQHLRDEHRDCIFCEYRSPSRHELERHVEAHHSGKSLEERRTHACALDGCAKSFTSKSNLAAHVRSAHRGVRFVCGQTALSGPDFGAWSGADGCSHGFSSKARLEDHVRFLHLGHVRPRMSRPPPRGPDVVDDLSGAADQAKRTVACPRCTHVFIRYHDLNVHLARDHGPLPVDPVLAPGPPVSAHDDPDALLAWPADAAPEDVFVALAGHGPPRDDWLGDEADVLLLARASPAPLPDPAVDPALAAP